MARYIDADAMIERLKKQYCEGCNNYNEIKCRSCETDDTIGFLEDAPTADVVEVVRCKDCVYWKDKNSKGTQGICLCGKKDMNYCGEFYPFANDFCSYGERRETNE